MLVMRAGFVERLLVNIQGYQHKPAPTDPKNGEWNSLPPHHLSYPDSATPHWLALDLSRKRGDTLWLAFYHVNYPPPTASGMVGASKFTGERLTDVLRPLLGLTSPPLAVSLVPNERIRSPSALIFNAALISLSWLVPQLEQVHWRTSKGKDETRW